jgi:hypothetical protein
MINITNEFRISLSVAFFLSSIGLPIVYFFNDAMGVFMTVCFSLASFCFFCMFAILPVLLDHKIRRIEDKHYPISPELVGVQKETAKASAQYDVYTSLLLGIGVMFFVIGLVGFVVAH